MDIIAYLEKKIIEYKKQKRAKKGCPNFRIKIANSLIKIVKSKRKNNLFQNMKRYIKFRAQISFIQQ